jgi:hypothetical protein
MDDTSAPPPSLPDPYTTPPNPPEIHLEEHGPLASYQWSAARVDQAAHTVKKIGIVVGALLLVAVTTALIWGALSFSSNLADLKAQVKDGTAQQAQFHADTSKANGALKCQSTALNSILTELAKAQQAAATHKVMPHFVYPKPC